LKKHREKIYYCDICGAPVLKPRFYEVEGATVILCDNCAKYGKLIKNTRPLQKMQKKTKKLESTLSTHVKKRFRDTHILDWELVENYGKKIREAREEAGLSQEDLSRLIAEPVSYIKKIEAEKVYPSEKVIEKLEKTLKIKLRTHVIETELVREKSPKVRSTDTEIKLGDILIIRKGNKKKSKRS